MRVHLLVTILASSALLVSAACSGDDSFKTEMTARLSRLEGERDQASKEAESLRQELRRLRAEAPAAPAPAAAPAAPAAPGAAGAPGPAGAPGAPAGAQPARPAPVAVPTGQARYVAGTDGTGVRVRSDCKDDAAGTGGLGEGTRVTVEAGRQDCAGWLQVRSPDGTSWVKEQYLSASTPTPTPTPVPVTPTSTPTPEPPTATPGPELPTATPAPVATATPAAPALGGNSLRVASFAPPATQTFSVSPGAANARAFQATVQYNISSEYGEIQLCRVPGQDPSGPGGEGCSWFASSGRLGPGVGTANLAGQTEIPDDKTELVILVLLKVPSGDGGERVIFRTRLTWQVRTT